MRHFCLLAVLSAAAVAAAQAPSESHEIAIWDAYQNLRTANTLELTMTGAETYGKVTDQIRAVLYLRRSMDGRTGLESFAQADLTIYRNERPTMRIVGDGVNLFRYDLVRRELSTTTYGFYGKLAPENYANNARSDMPKLLAQLRAATPGLATYLVRLAVELNPAGSEFAARFNNWTPGMFGRSFSEVPPMWRENNVVRDPITGHPFPEGDNRYVFFGYDREAPDRTVAFDLYDADDSDTKERWEVASVSVALRSPDRTAAVSIVPKAIDPAPDGAFKPYTDSATFRVVTRGR